MTGSSVTLNNQVTMPQLGFGVWQVDDDAAEKAVGTALEVGYRSVDTTRQRCPARSTRSMHPQLAQAELRELHAKLGIATEAWSPLGQGKGLLENPVLAQIAAKHGKSAAQVAIRWSLQLGNVVIPKSVTPARIKENLDVFGFELDEDDLAQISTLDTGQRLGPDPAKFG
jgi:diketogulonate reductase-like aldo/keto reductase